MRTLRHPHESERPQAMVGASICPGNAPLLLAAVGVVGVVVAGSPVRIADLASMVKYATACKVARSSAAKSVTASAEITAVETASQSTIVGASSVKAPAVAASKPAAPTSQRFMVGERQSAGKQHNDGDRQFLPMTFLSCCNAEFCSTPLRSLPPAIFPISAVHHVHLLLGWCHALTPRSPRRLAWKGLYSPHAINSPVTSPCSAPLFWTVLLTDGEAPSLLTELARE